MTETQRAANARYKAKKRAERPPKSPTVDTVAVDTLEVARVSCGLSCHTLSLAVKKHRGWWRIVIRSRRLTVADHAQVAEYLRTFALKAIKAAP